MKAGTAFRPASASAFQEDEPRGQVMPRKGGTGRDSRPPAPPAPPTLARSRGSAAASWEDRGADHVVAPGKDRDEDSSQQQERKGKGCPRKTEVAQ